MPRMTASVNRHKAPRCSVSECNRQAQTRRVCKAHGGGVRCRAPECPKLAQSQGLCVAHGGGRRCRFTDCVKLAQYRGLCLAHGGGKRCRVPKCLKYVQVRGYCKAHAKLLDAAGASPTSASASTKSTRKQDMSTSLASRVESVPSRIAATSKSRPKTAASAGWFNSPVCETEDSSCPEGWFPVSVQVDVDTMIRDPHPPRHATPPLFAPTAPEYPPLELYRPACWRLYCQRRNNYY